MNKTARIFVTVLAAAGLSLVAFSATAGHKSKQVSVIKVGDGDGGVVTLKFDGEASLADLADGETRTMTTVDGDTVTVSRAGDTLSVLTASGKTVQIPAMEGDVIRAHSAHQQKRIKIRHKAGDDASELLIVAPGGLSDSERETIRSALVSAGIDKEIMFIGDGVEANVDVDVEIDD